jgi:hypothetical protein
LGSEAAIVARGGLDDLDDAASQASSQQLAVAEIEEDVRSLLQENIEHIAEVIRSQLRSPQGNLLAFSCLDYNSGNTDQNLKWLLVGFDIESAAQWHCVEMLNECVCYACHVAVLLC